MGRWDRGRFSVPRRKQQMNHTVTARGANHSPRLSFCFFLFFCSFSPQPCPHFPSKNVMYTDHFLTRKKRVEYFVYQRFWDKFYDAKVSSYYFQFYAISARRKKTIVSAICLLATSAFLLQMSQNTTNHLVWIVLVISSQLVALFQPLFPYEKQYHAACYIYEDVNQLCSEMEAYWRTIGAETSDEEINQKIILFSDKQDKIENRFATADLFPQSQRMHAKAVKNADYYFRGLN